MTDRPLALPHVLYRLYGPDDLILYIGVTRKLRERLAAHRHRSRQTWWPFVVRYETVAYPDYYSARDAETIELRKTRPLCNPVIPLANGKHITTPDGRNPVKSLWAVAQSMAVSVNEETLPFVLRAIERELERIRREARRD